MLDDALGQVVGDVSWRDVAAGDTVGLIVVRLSSTDAAVRFAEAPAVMGDERPTTAMVVRWKSIPGMVLNTRVFLAAKPERGRMRRTDAPLHSKARNVDRDHSRRPSSCGIAAGGKGAQWAIINLVSPM